jgi:hypothetical protein
MSRFPFEFLFIAAFNAPLHDASYDCIPSH